MNLSVFIRDTLFMGDIEYAVHFFAGIAITLALSLYVPFWFVTLLAGFGAICWEFANNILDKRSKVDWYDVLYTFGGAVLGGMWHFIYIVV